MDEVWRIAHLLEHFQPEGVILCTNTAELFEFDTELIGLVIGSRVGGWMEWGFLILRGEE